MEIFSTFWVFKTKTFVSADCRMKYSVFFWFFGFHFTKGILPKFEKRELNLTERECEEE